MSFYILATVAVLSCLMLVASASILPRHKHSRHLKEQLRDGGGHVFTPDKATWRSYLARTGSDLPLGTIFLYAAVVSIIVFAEASPILVAVAVAIGVYLLLIYMLIAVPPTFGITRKGVTILSWRPVYPVGSWEGGSRFIPWQAVELCAIDNSFFTILTKRLQVRIVYPPEVEEKVCSFIDTLLRRRGYEIRSK